MENIQHDYGRIEIGVPCNFNCLQGMLFPKDTCRDPEAITGMESEANTMLDPPQVVSLYPGAIPSSERKDLRPHVSGRQ